MRSRFLIILSLMFIVNFIPQSFAEVQTGEILQARIKIDYQLGLYNFTPVLDGDFSIMVGEPFITEVKFKNSKRKTKLSILVTAINTYDKSLSIQAYRQDYRGLQIMGTPRAMNFTHQFNRGMSVISLRGQDPNSNGSFRIQLDF